MVPEKSKELAHAQSHEAKTEDGEAEVFVLPPGLLQKLGIDLNVIGSIEHCPLDVTTKADLTLLSNPVCSINNTKLVEPIALHTPADQNESINNTILETADLMKKSVLMSPTFLGATDLSNPEEIQITSTIDPLKHSITNCSFLSKEMMNNADYLNIDKMPFIIDQPLSEVAKIQSSYKSETLNLTFGNTTSPSQDQDLITMEDILGFTNGPHLNREEMNKMDCLNIDKMVFIIDQPPNEIAEIQSNYGSDNMNLTVSNTTSPSQGQDLITLEDMLEDPTKLKTTEDHPDEAYLSDCSNSNSGSITEIQPFSNQTGTSPKTKIIMEEILSPSQFDEIKKMLRSNDLTFLKVPANSVINSDRCIKKFINNETITVKNNASERNDNLSKLKPSTESVVNSDISENETLKLINNVNLEVKDFPKGAAAAAAGDVKIEYILQDPNPSICTSENNLSVCLDFVVNNIDIHLKDEDTETNLENFINEMTSSNSDGIMKKIEESEQESPLKKCDRIVDTHTVQNRDFDPDIVNNINSTNFNCSCDKIELKQKAETGNTTKVNKLVADEEKYNKKTGCIESTDNSADNKNKYTLKHVNSAEVETGYRIRKHLKTNVWKDQIYSESNFQIGETEVDRNKIKGNANVVDTKFNMTKDHSNVIDTQDKTELEMNIIKRTGHAGINTYKNKKRTKNDDEFKKQTNKTTENIKDFETDEFISSNYSRTSEECETDKFNSVSNNKVFDSAKEFKMATDEDKVKEIAMVLMQFAKTHSNFSLMNTKSNEIVTIPAKRSNPLKLKKHIQGVEKPGGSGKTCEVGTTSKIIKTYRKSNKSKPQAILESMAVSSKNEMHNDLSQLDIVMNDNPEDIGKSLEFCICGDYGNLAYYGSKTPYAHIHFWEKKIIDCDRENAFSIYNNSESFNVTIDENMNTTLDVFSSDSSGCLLHNICWHSFNRNEPSDTTRNEFDVVEQVNKHNTYCLLCGKAPQLNKDNIKMNVQDCGVKDVQPNCSEIRKLGNAKQTKKVETSFIGAEKSSHDNTSKEGTRASLVVASNLGCAVKCYSRVGKSCSNQEKVCEKSTNSMYVEVERENTSEPKSVVKEYENNKVLVINDIAVASSGADFSRKRGADAGDEDDVINIKKKLLNTKKDMDKMDSADNALTAMEEVNPHAIEPNMTESNQDKKHNKRDSAQVKSSAKSKKRINEDVMQKEDEPPNKKSMKCGVCDLTLSEQEWEDHISQKHCFIAWRSGTTLNFEEPELLEKLQSRIKKKFECSFCGYRNKNAANFLQHARQCVSKFENKIQDTKENSRDVETRQGDPTTSNIGTEVEKVQDTKENSRDIKTRQEDPTTSNIKNEETVEKVTENIYTKQSRLVEDTKENSRDIETRQGDPTTSNIENEETVEKAQDTKENSHDYETRQEDPTTSNIGNEETVEKVQDTKENSRDIETRHEDPTTLNIGNKETLEKVQDSRKKSQDIETRQGDHTTSNVEIMAVENVTENIPNNDLSANDSVQCGACNAHVHTSEWVAHIAEKHYYMAWKYGERAMTYLQHVKNCKEGLVQDTRENLRDIETRQGDLTTSNVGTEVTVEKVRDTKENSRDIETHQTDLITTNVGSEVTAEKVQDTKGNSRDIETRQTDLITTNVGSEVTAEKVTENIPNNDLSANDSVQCGVCNEHVHTSEWVAHIAENHYYMAWKFGDNPVDLTNDEEIRVHLLAVLKETGELKCPKCGIIRKRAMKYLQHVRNCKEGLVQDTRENLRDIETRQGDLTTSNVGTEVTVEKVHDTKENSRDIETRQTDLITTNVASEVTAEKVQDTKGNSRDIETRQTDLITTNVGSEVTAEKVHDTKENSRDIETRQTDLITTNVASEVTAEKVQDTKGNSRDIETCQTDLITTNVGSEVTAEKVTENIPNNDLSANDSVQCGVCNEHVHTSEWVAHIAENHYYMAWKFGDNPVDLTNDEEIRVHLLAVLKETGELKCPKCGIIRKRAMKYLQHVRNCKEGLVQDTRENLRDIETRQGDLTTSNVGTEVTVEKVHDTKENSRDIEARQTDLITTNVASEVTAEKVQDTKGNSRDIETRQTDLITTNVGSEVTAEKVTENIPNNDLSANDSVQCGVCNEHVHTSEWVAHIAENHYYMAWKFGDNPVDLTNDEEIRVHLLAVLKETGELKCPKCGIIRKRAMKYLQHVRNCKEGLVQDTREKLRDIETRQEDLTTSKVGTEVTVEKVQDTKENSLDIETRQTDLITTNVGSEVTAEKVQDRKENSRDIEIRQGYLITTNVETEVTAEKVTENIPNNDLSVNDSVQCGVCNEHVHTSEWVAHIAEKHYYMAWKVCDDPVDLTNDEEIRVHLLAVLKETGELKCPKCGIIRKRAMKYLQHVRNCKEGLGPNSSSVDISTNAKSSDISADCSLPLLQVTKCGVCKREVYSEEWITHIAQNHSYLAWKDGETPLDLDNETDVRAHLTAVLKEVGKLTCSKCGFNARRRAKEFNDHRKNCPGLKVSSTSVDDSIDTSMDITTYVEPVKTVKSSMLTQDNSVTNTNVQESIIHKEVVTCGVCEERVTDWIGHIARKHDYIAWKEGEDVINTEDTSMVQQYLNDLSRDINGLVCPKCGFMRKYASPFLQHVKYCTGEVKAAEQHDVPCRTYSKSAQIIVKCAVCQAEVIPDMWTNHIFEQHQYMAWQEGQSLDLNNQDEVEEHLTRILRQHFYLQCNKCCALQKDVCSYVKHFKDCKGKPNSNKKDNKKLTCVICWKEVDKKKWSQHRMDEHYNVAWFVGGVPVNLSNPNKIIQDINEYKARYKELKCRLCGASRASSIGFYAHVVACKKTEQEIDMYKNVCDICGKKYLYFYHNQHMAWHTQQGLKAESIKEAIEKQQVKTELKEEEFVEGRGRRAAQKARSIIQKFKDADRFKCPDCGFGADTKEELKQHSCTVIEDQDFSDSDESCKPEDESEESEESDIDSNISAEENGLTDNEDSDCFTPTSTPRVRRRERVSAANSVTRFPLKSTSKSIIGKYGLEFHEHHFLSKGLFPELRSFDCKPIDDEILSKYLPPLEESCKVQLLQNNWETLKRFEAKKIDQTGKAKRSTGDQALFAGGYIQCVSWAPPYGADDEGLGHFLAVVGHCDSDQPRFDTVNISSDPGLIQIWDFGNFKKPAEFALGIAHDFGYVWAVDWCPSGARDSLPKGDVAADGGGGGMKRLGLLSIACANGAAYVFSVPYPSMVKRENKRIYRMRPVIELRLAMNSERTLNPATAISWTKQNDHKFIIVGYSDGTTAYYDLNTESPFLKTKENNRIVLFPYHDERLHSSCITGLDTYPTLHEDTVAGAVCSSSVTGSCLMARPAVRPAKQHSYSAITDTQFQPFWPSSFIVGDEGNLSTSLNEVEWMGGGRRWGGGSASAACWWCGGVAIAPTPLLRLAYTHPMLRLQKGARARETFGMIRMKPLSGKKRKLKNDDFQLKIEPTTYEEAVSMYGLELRLDQEIINQTNRLPRESFPEKTPERFPLCEVTSMAFCPASTHHKKLAVATHAGIVFLINVRL